MQDTRSATLASERQEAMFNALSGLMRNFVQMADLGQHGVLLKKLEECLEDGWMLRVQFSIGAAGPLGCMLTAVSPFGQTVEIMNIDAPPSRFAFKLEEHIGGV